MWLHTLSREDLLAAATEIERRPGARTLPLYGVPFGVKDSIDVAGVPTTLACPGYSYVPTTTAAVVQRLLDAGALFVGKTSLDQFATGLNGTRTPHTIPRSVFGDELISGGSSSGSALAVALGQVPFAVATDTAGSGRVPAALNGVIGFKPSRGLISAVGLVPGVQVPRLHQPDGGLRRRRRPSVRRARRPRRRRSLVPRPGPGVRRRGPGSGSVSLPSTSSSSSATRLSAPRTSAFGAASRFTATSSRSRSNRSSPRARCSTRAPGWLSDSSSSASSSTKHPDEIHPVVRAIFEGGRRYTAVDAFAALQRLQELKADVDRLWQHMDVLVVPTIGTTYTVAEVLADPVDTNTALGHYTHFGNLLDLVGVAVPTGTTVDGRPASALLLGAARTDDTVLQLAARLLDEPRESSRPSHHDRGAPVNPSIDVPAEPSPFHVVAGQTALVIIDMQRDFLLPGGFGETLGNDVSQLQKVVPPLVDLLSAARAAGMTVIHTREGHLPDLSDCPPAKLQPRRTVQADRRPRRLRPDPGPRRVRPRHRRRARTHPRRDRARQARQGRVLRHRPAGRSSSDAGITQLIVTGVTTEVCVHTTTREANDRGYECLVVSDCVGSYFPEFQRVGLEMVKAQGGIFGWVADSHAVITALAAVNAPTPV